MVFCVEKNDSLTVFCHTNEKKKAKGGHVRFKDEDTNEDDEDEMMDVEKNKEEEKEEEEGEQRGVSHDFGPDPEFTIRKPVANLKTMMMMMAAEEEVTEVKDKEDKRRRSAVKLRNKWTEEKGASSDACYITQIESNFDFSKVCYRTSANEAKVFDTTTTNTTNTNNNNNDVMILKHERAMTDAHFPVPNELTTILSCSHDNTVREWDARTNNNNCAVAQARVPNHILGKNGSLETCSIGGANETILAVSCGEKILFYDRRMIRQGGGGGGKETMMIKQFEDAHSETVTKLRFHPEKRHILQTSSVDGLTCTFNLLNEIDDENSLVSIGTANAAINEFGFLSSTTSSGSTSKNILWALTGIEEIHLFDCDAGVATCGVEIGHVKNAREKAREAAKQAKAMSVKKASFSSSISKKGLKDLIENGVDYIINVIDGGEANNHKYYACCGTINGTVGLFPIAYDEIAMRSETSTQPLTLLAPEYVLPNDSSSEQGGRGGDREDLMMKGHGDIVRCLLASSSSTAMTTDSQNVLHLYTGGEDSSVCSWTTTKDEGHNNNNNNNNDNNNNNNNNNNNVGFGGGAMRNSPSSSIRSGRESPY